MSVGHSRQKSADGGRAGSMKVLERSSVNAYGRRWRSRERSIDALIREGEGTALSECRVRRYGLARRVVSFREQDEQ